MESPYRDTFRIYGYHFGNGEKTMAIVGAMRGDEIQQQYICSQIVNILSSLENANRLNPDCEILVIPSVNPFSMNIHKRFWTMDGTDINRMFPGYNKGETTQRIAAALFDEIKGYEYGIQTASFYLPGDFVPHVRMIHTGYEDSVAATLFGLPFVSVSDPQPFDTTLLNYNWQIWDTKAFSLFGGRNDHIEGSIPQSMVGAILRFMRRKGMIKGFVTTQPDYNSRIINESELINIKSPVAGFLYKINGANDRVLQGDVVARIINPYEGTVEAEIKSPTDGIIFFAYDSYLAMQNTPLFKLIPL